MKVTLIFGAILIAVVSCQKNGNPTVDNSLPEARFTLSADESRGTDHIIPWTISGSGITDSVTESLDQMYVTKYNKLTLKVTPVEASFQGVNVTSSNPKAVKAEYKGKDQEGALLYSLSYEGNGDAQISVWNGKGNANRCTFPIKAQEIIELKGVWWKVDDEEFLVRHLWRTSQERDAQEKDVYNWDGVKECDWNWRSFNEKNAREYERRYYTSSGREISFEDWSANPDYSAWTEEGRNKYWVDYVLNIHPLTFSRLEPENASYREIRFSALKFYTTEETLGKTSLATRDCDAFARSFGVENNWENTAGDVSCLYDLVVWLHVESSCHCIEHKLTYDFGRYMYDMELKCGDRKWISTAYY